MVESHGGYYPPGHHTQYWSDRQYPEVNPKMLNQSAQASKQLMGEASIVLNKLASSEAFGSQLMSAAQQSKTEEVERLIHSLGVGSDVAIYYNPDGLRLEFRSNDTELQCCALTIALRWR